MSYYKKKICVVSSSRAEFGILKNLINQLQKEKKLITKLVVLDNHKIYKNKNKSSELNELKIKKYLKIKLPLRFEKTIEIINRSSIILKRLSNFLKKEKVNLIVLLGDRYEILVSAYVAVLNKIPIAHISGGDETKGSYDNQFRHAISKFSNFHFVTNKLSENRLKKMGENKNAIFNYGSLSMENIEKVKKVKKFTIEKNYNIKLKKKNFIVTYHPETLSDNLIKKVINLIESLIYFNDYMFIFTSPNNDEGSDLIKKIILKYVKRYNNIKYLHSLGQYRYFQFLHIVDGVIGNSSSGMCEVPSFKIGTINVGNRQDGRLKLKSVVNVGYSKKSIIKAVKKIISKSFLENIKDIKNPYFKKNTTSNIISKIKFILKKNISIEKKFYE